MQRTAATKAAANALQRLFPAVLLLCLAVSGCGDTCYSGFWNGSGGVTVSNSCPLTKATGAVVVQMSTASAPSTGSAPFPPSLPSARASPRASPWDVQHIFVALRSIQAHPSTVADQDSSDWQELAPDLAARPMQLDLLAPLVPLALYGDSPSLALPARANVPTTIPADEYRQLRLRLIPLHPSPDDLIPESNACGNVGWNCIVFADRSVRPLEFGGAAAEFHITMEHDTNSVFRVLPGEVIHLSIEFDAASSVFFPSNVAARLVPVFSVVSRTAPPAATAQ